METLLWTLLLSEKLGRRTWDTEAEEEFNILIKNIYQQLYCVLLCKRKCYALENSGRQMKQLVNCESKETRRHLKEEAENKRRLHNTTSTTSVLTISQTREHEHNKHQVKEYSVENFGLKFEMINVEICPGFYKGDSGYFKIHFLSSKNWFHSFRDVPTHQSDF